MLITIPNPLGWLARRSKPAPLPAKSQALASPLVINIPTPAKAAQEPQMSLFSNIAKAEHTFAAWAEKQLTALENKAPTIERVIDTTLSYVGPVLQLGLGALGQTAAAAEAGVIIAKAHQDLAVASALVTDFGPTPTAASMFASVQANLSGILTATNVTNPTTVATVTKAIGEVGTLAAAVQTAAAAIAASATPATA